MSLAPLGGIAAGATAGATTGASGQAGDGGFAAAIDALLAALIPQGTTPGAAGTTLAGQPATDVADEGTAEPATDLDPTIDAALLAGLVSAGLVAPDLTKAGPMPTGKGGGAPALADPSLASTSLADLAIGGIGGLGGLAATAPATSQRLAAEPIPATATPTPATAGVPQTASDPGAIAPAPGSDATLPQATASTTAAAATVTAAASADQQTTPTTDDPATGSTIPRVEPSPVAGPSVQDGPGGDGLPDRGAQARAGTAASPASGVTHATTRAADPADPTATDPTAPSPTTPIVVGSVAPTAATTAATPAPSAQAATPVTQVAAETVRMFQAGNGLHRVTITLNPESLGQVRVSLSVKDGQVSVRLAAAESARHTLVEGAPELRRLLEAVGATDVRVVVRDLSGAETSRATTWSFGQDPSASGQQGQGRSTGQDGLNGQPAGNGAGANSDQHAGTRAGSTARDGSTDGSSPLRPDPVVTPRTRSTGVDVTV